MGVKVRFRRCAWWVFINHGGRRKAKKIGGDREAAKRIGKALEERLASADFQLHPEATETLKAYAQTWIASANASLKRSTVRFYQDNLDNHIYPALGHIPVSRICRADVKRLIGVLSAKSLRPKTVTGIIRTLSTVLSEAVEDEKLPANPALRPGRLRRHLLDPNAPKRNTIDPYTREEVEILLATASKNYPEWYPFLLCALRSGLRLGELRALEWGHLDWRSRFIRVERNFVEGQFTTPKNGLWRDVDMSLQLRATLRLWRRQQRAAWLKRGRPLPLLVFPSDAETALDDSNIRKAMLAIVRKAEVRRHRSIVHVLRHTFGSLLIQQGESLTYVKEQMGHASIQLTVDIYGHLVPGGNRGAVDRLDTWGATGRNPGATSASERLLQNQAKSLVVNGEPPRNRTENPQIKSLLLCQLS